MEYIHKLEECNCCRQVALALALGLEVLKQIHKKELERQQILYGSQIVTLKLANNMQRIKMDILSCGG